MKKLLFLFIIPLFAACSDSDSPSRILSSGVLTVPNLADTWVYISLADEGSVVGQCALADTAALRQWSNRLDWDLAICNGMIRTNGGTSGIGHGAATSSSAPFEAISDPALPNYHGDADSVAVW